MSGRTAPGCARGALEKLVAPLEEYVEIDGLLQEVGHWQPAVVDVVFAESQGDRLVDRAQDDDGDVLQVLLGVAYLPRNPEPGVFVLREHNVEDRQIRPPFLHVFDRLVRFKQTM